MVAGGAVVPLSFSSPKLGIAIMVKDKKASEFATRDYTIHLSKRLYGVTFKKRAPRAVREVKKFAQQMMKTRCVVRRQCRGCLPRVAVNHSTTILFRIPLEHTRSNLAVLITSEVVLLVLGAVFFLLRAMHVQLCLMACSGDFALSTLRETSLTAIKVILSPLSMTVYCVWPATVYPRSLTSL